MADWIKEIKIEDLPERYQEIALIVGLEHTLKLAEYFGKQGVYFVSIDSLIRQKKETYIRKHFNGRNHKDLARATGYSERWIYEILKAAHEDRQAKLF